MHKYIILGHKNVDVDSVVSGILLEKLLIRKGYDAQFIIPDETIDEEVLAICERYEISVKKYQKKLHNNPSFRYILVDHHVRDEVSPVVAIIDHHPTTQKIDIPYYHNERASSTACKIAEGHESMFSKDEIQLAVLATFVDTASFHSSKTQERDTKWAMQMIQKYHFSYNQLYQDGLCLTKVDSPNSALLHGLKEYTFAKQKIASSYIQIAEREQLSNQLPNIINRMQKYVKEKQLSLFVFLLHDMTKFQSSVYYITNQTISCKDFDHYVSRGSEIMPSIEKKFIKKRK